jgi:hypothetical protein
MHACRRCYIVVLPQKYARIPGTRDRLLAENKGLERDPGTLDWASIEVEKSPNGHGKACKREWRSPRRRLPQEDGG